MAILNFAYFVSPHGFGHAARACAVIEALGRCVPGAVFYIYTTVPRWFFSESLEGDFEYRSVQSDVGLVQLSPLKEDLEATVARLETAPWRDDAAVDRLADEILEAGCNAVVADISPLGLMVANRAGIPSVLVENFTWDWIYENTPDAPPRLVELGREMTSHFCSADLRIQTTPVCSEFTGAITVPPIARTLRIDRVEVRRQLEIPDNEPLVLLSMGGVRWKFDRETALMAQDQVWVVVPGGADHVRRCGQTILLPFHSNFYHPDLVAAADVVVGKLGYSTVAEVSRSGAALAYMVRPRFPESAVLAEYVEENLIAAEIDEEEFRKGNWIGAVEKLLGAGRRQGAEADGAALAAAAIVKRVVEI